MRDTDPNRIALQERTRREILHRSDLIPPLPDFVVRLLGLFNDPDTEPRDIERHLQNDQVLVAKMLAMVNSPFFGQRHAVRTVKDAVMLLGFRGLRSFVIAASTGRYLQRDFSCYGHDSKGLWTHAVAVAAAAREIARSCRLGAEDVELMFLAGLLHDIGKLAIEPYVAEDSRHVKLCGDDACAIEVRAVGIDHTEAGALVCAKWNLPLEVEEALKSHHGGAAVGDPRRAAVVRLADAVAHERGHGYIAGRAPRAVVMQGDLAALGLSAPAWDALRGAAVAAMDAAHAALGALTP